MADFTAKSAILSNTARGGWQHRSGGLATPLGGGWRGPTPGRGREKREILGSSGKSAVALNPAISASFCQRPARRDHRPVRAGPPRQHLRVQRRRVVPQGAQGPGGRGSGGGLWVGIKLYIINLDPVLRPPIPAVRHPQRRVNRVERLGVVAAQPPQGVHRGAASPASHRGFDVVLTGIQRTSGAMPAPFSVRRKTRTMPRPAAGPVWHDAPQRAGNGPPRGGCRRPEPRHLAGADPRPGTAPARRRRGRR